MPIFEITETIPLIKEFGGCVENKKQTLSKTDVYKYVFYLTRKTTDS